MHLPYYVVHLRRAKKALNFYLLPQMTVSMKQVQTESAVISKKMKPAF
jgi:hypothetical protein